MRLAWATDIHLDFAGFTAFRRFVAEVGDADALLVTGDIAEAPTLGRHLDALADALWRPVYFVLGNHDFYHGSVPEVRRQAAEWTRESPWLRWLPAHGPVALGPGTVLVGHDGWADGRLGDYGSSTMMLNDYHLIAELAGLPKDQRLRVLHSLGDEAAAHLRTQLGEALAGHGSVVVATHAPPFAEAAWHEGRRTGDGALPHFASGAVGEVLREAAARHPDRQVEVLCGHTHHAADERILPNLRVRVGGADYGRPRVQAVLEYR